MRWKEGRKGQMMSMPFVVIFAIIVMGLVLVFGARSIMDVGRVADVAELSRFVAALQDAVEVYYNFDVGSRNELSTGLPSKIDKVCFVNPGEAVNVGGLDEFFVDILESNSKDNLYVLPLDAFESPAPDFMVEYLRVNPVENPLCFETKGKLRAVLETKADAGGVYVEISRI